MAETVTGERRPSKGRKRHVFVPLDLDELDRPTWALRPSGAVPGARWVEVPDGNGTDPTGYRRGFIAFYAPRLLLPAIPPPELPRAYGRPRTEADPAVRVRCQATACAVDLLGNTLYSIAHGDLTFGSDDARSKQTRRDYKAGRRSLWREGVLPWAAWPEGCLPDGDWRRARELLEALTEWEREGVRNPAPAPPTPAEMLRVTIVSVHTMGRFYAPIWATAAAVLRQWRAEEVAPWRYEDSLAGREEAESEEAD